MPTSSKEMTGPDLSAILEELKLLFSEVANYANCVSVLIWATAREDLTLLFSIRYK
jgi:hypothetical protein